jgi:hypothetical protein
MINQKKEKEKKRKRKSNKCELFFVFCLIRVNVVDHFRLKIIQKMSFAEENYSFKKFFSYDEREK